MPPKLVEDTPQSPFEHINEDAPEDAEPFVESEPAPKDDEVHEVPNE